MDLHLDGGGGAEALTELRRDPRLRHIPVVAMNLAPVRKAGPTRTFSGICADGAEVPSFHQEILLTHFH